MELSSCLNFHEMLDTKILMVTNFKSGAVHIISSSDMTRASKLFYLMHSKKKLFFSVWLVEGLTSNRELSQRGFVSLTCLLRVQDMPIRNIPSHYALKLV